MVRQSQQLMTADSIVVQHAPSPASFLPTHTPIGVVDVGARAEIQGERHGQTRTELTPMTLPLGEYAKGKALIAVTSDNDSRTKKF